ncbi:MAG: succinylglutamate desuccinylase/aspartoacylase family protein [Myxococcota bacterium]
MKLARISRLGQTEEVRLLFALCSSLFALPQGVIAETAIADQDGAPKGNLVSGAVLDWGPIEILETTVSTGARASMSLVTSASYSGQRIGIPVLVARGAKPGPTLCLTAGIHGDELNGVEVVRRSIQRVELDQLAGMLMGLPVVNLHGFRRGERDLPDRRDLNRHFPGRPKGSAASRVAHRVFSFLQAHCDEAIDFHTGSARRSNFPQVRADVGQPETLELALRLQPPIIVHSEGTRGMLRRALTQVGIPTVTYESGEAMRFQVDVIEGVVLGVLRSAALMEGKPTLPPPPDIPPEVFLQSHWVRVDRGGILTNRVELGAVVKKGQVLGVVQNPFSESAIEILAPHDGRVIGCAQPQLVLPGFAAFHLGYDPREEVPQDETDDPAVEHGAAEDME